MTFTRDGFVPVSQPRALRDDELPAVVADYVDVIEGETGGAREPADASVGRA